MSQVVYCKYWTALSTAATITGDAVKVPYNGHVSATFTWTDDTTGTFKLQHRAREGGTWVDTPNASLEFTTQPNGTNATTVAVNWTNVPGHEFRFVFTRSAGTTGTVTTVIAMGDRQEV